MGALLLFIVGLLKMQVLSRPALPETENNMNFT
jgi:hypothetical protein